MTCGWSVRALLHKTSMNVRTTLCAVVFATICASLAAQNPDPAQPAGPELSKAVRERIDGKFKKVEAFKDWRVATVDSATSS